MFTRILFATDGTASSLHAAEAAVALFGRQQDAFFTIVAAIAPKAVGIVDADRESAEGRKARMRDEALRALRATNAVFHSYGLPFRSVIAEGDCDCTAIANIARKDLSDLIIMGSTEKSLTKAEAGEFVNLTEEVMQRASVPVMVIPLTLTKAA